MWPWWEKTGLPMQETQEMWAQSPGWEDPLDKVNRVNFLISLCIWRLYLNYTVGLPGGPGVKNPLANVGDMGSIPGPGRHHMPQGS